MRLEDVKNIAIIGAGIMGHGIAQTYALGGYQVSLSDINDTLLNCKSSAKMAQYGGVLRSLPAGY